MLNMAKVAAGGEEYYLATAAAERPGLSEAAGVWLGEGALQLGLTGAAEPPSVRRLLRGSHPDGGKLLADPGRRHVAAFDCTFSVPKSVSLVQAFSPEETVRREMRFGHEAAVRASLRYLEEAGAAGRLSSMEGGGVVTGVGLVGVGFLHRLSRAGDPHLHTHVLIANLALDPEHGGGRPLDARGLYAQCRTAGALYETHLRHELSQRLGVEWKPLNGRCWSDVKGLDPAVIRCFSQRSVQIEAAVAAEGWRGPAANRAMAELTRPPKDLGHTYEEVLERARWRLWRAGVSDTRLRDVCRQAASPASTLEEGGDRIRQPETGPVAERDWLDEAVRQLPALSVDGTFTLRDAIRARCAAAPAGRSVEGALAARWASASPSTPRRSWWLQRAPPLP